MIFIEDTFNDLNLKTLPEVIKNRLYKLTDIEIYNPYVNLFSKAYVPVIDYLDLMKKIKEGLLGSNNELYDIDNFDSIYDLYTVGFQKGYTEFTEKIKSNSSIFSPNDEVIAHKIANYVFRGKDSLEYGNSRGFQYLSKKKPKLNDNLESEDDEEILILSDYRIEDCGEKNGMEYKAWQIILDNIPVFEPIFLKIESQINVNNPSEENEITNLPELELSTQKDQIRLLYELGVIEFLQDKYEESLKNNINQTAHLLAQILNLNRGSVQPTLNALLTDNSNNRNYPKKTNAIKAIIDKLNSLESK